MMIGLPSGIGDCSWAYSKLKHVGPLQYLVADGWPYRTKPWFELLPQCASVEYGTFTYNDILKFEALHNLNGATRWAELTAKGWGAAYIEPNLHLEMGHPLAEWLPDLPTDYHYEMVTQATDQERATALLHDMPRPLWGVSAASYRGSEAWKTWTYADWSEFLKWFRSEVDGTILLMGGFWDDLTSRLAEDGYPDLVGKTSVGAMVEVLKHLDGFIGFSSGLGILNTVLWGKTFMLWPEHQVALSRSWADPEMLDAGSYEASQWVAPDLVAKRVRAWLRVPVPAQRAVIQR